MSESGFYEIFKSLEKFQKNFVAVDCDIFNVLDYLVTKLRNVLFNLTTNEYLLVKSKLFEIFIFKLKLFFKF